MDTNDQMERRITRLEARNARLNKDNQQLRELTNEFERACTLVVKSPGLQTHNFCLTGHPPSVCPPAAAKKALDLKARLSIGNKRLGGE